MRNEAESGSRLRITADAFAFQGSDRRITPTAARSATWRTNNYHGQYLSTDKNRQALPDAPDFADLKFKKICVNLRNLRITHFMCLCAFVVTSGRSHGFASDKAA
jgi:hypothetical protein